MAEASNDILKAYLLRAAVAAERGISWVRLALAVLGSANIAWAVKNRPASIVFGTPKYVLMLLVLVLAVGYSLLTLRRSRQTGRLPCSRAVASVVDAVLVLGIVGPSVIWPSQTFLGLLGLPHVSFFVLAVCASGARLSPRAVVASAVSNGVFVTSLLIYDRLHNPPAMHNPLDNYGAFAILMVGGALYSYTTTDRTRQVVYDGAEAMVRTERLRLRFGVFVSPEVARRVLDMETLRPGGERRVIAVLFSDLRGFTQYCADVPPEQLVAEFNAYLEAMVAVIAEEQGVVDKYMGDAIMAVWGVPANTGDEAARAVRAAYKMQKALDVHNEARAKRGLIPLRQGIGVHYGEAVAGNVGTSNRLQYTVMGETVNLASRLQEATKDLGYSILISKETVDASDHAQDLPELVALGQITLRGRGAPIQVFGTT